MSWLSYLLLAVGGGAMFTLAAVAFKFNLAGGILILLLALGYTLGAAVAVAIE